MGDPQPFTSKCIPFSKKMTVEKKLYSRIDLIFACAEFAFSLYRLSLPMLCVANL